MTDILILTTSEGHYSIAVATQQLMNKLGYSTHFYFHTEIGLWFYQILYRYLPKSFSLLFDFSHAQQTQKLTKFFLLHEHQKALTKIIQTHQPKIIINTSFGFSPAIRAIRKHHPQIAFINIIPNPRNHFPLDVPTDADALAVFDASLAKEIRHKAAKNQDVLVAGWFIRQEFEQTYVKKSVRLELQLDPDKQTVFFAGGSEGAAAIIRPLKKILKQSQLQVIVACGSNDLLYQQVKLLKVHPETTMLPLKFTHEIVKYMQAADLIVGKAGPNTIFEAVALKVPFVSITHVGGLEDRNLDLIQEYNIGRVEETPKNQADLVLQLMKAPKELEEIQSAQQKLHKQILQDRAKFVQLVREKLGDR